jgi:hypothetical protein
MPDKFMPRIYRWLLTASGVTYLIVGWADGRGPTWGRVEQVAMIFAGIMVLIAAWDSTNRAVAHVAAYAAGIGGLFELVNHMAANRPVHYAAAALWVTFTAYTVLLVAFGWVRGPPK